MPLLEGANAFTFWARSSYGDTSEMGTASGSLDSAAPSISGEVSGTAGDDGWFVSEVTVSASAADPAPGSGLASLEVQIDGGGWAAYSGSIVLGDGEHTVDLRAADAAGNTAQSSQSVQVDTLTPDVSLTAGGSFCPGCGQTLEIDIGVADAGSGIAAWTLTAGGVAVASGSGPANETLAWNGSGLGGGAHTLTLEARDAAGNASSASQSIDLMVPTPKPDPPTDEPEDEAPPPGSGGAPTSAPSPTPGPTTTSGSDPTADSNTEQAQTSGSDVEPTPTPLTLPFAGLLQERPFSELPAAPELLPEDGPPPSDLAGPQGGLSTVSTDGGSTPVFGAAALALIAAASAAGLSRLRKRQKEQAALRKEMAERNQAAEAREEAQRWALAVAAANAANAARAKTEQLLENFRTRLPRILPSDDLWSAAAGAANAAKARAGQIVENFRTRLPWMLPAEDLLRPSADQLEAEGGQSVSGERAAEFDMGEWKQQDLAAAEAAAEAQRQQAYQTFRDLERSTAVVPVVPAAPPERSWWQRTWDDVKQTAHNVTNWVDQHQAEIALGIGVVAGVAAIVVSAGTATPLVVAAGWAALAAGTTVAVGTVGLNAYHGRALGGNLLRNTAYSLGGVAAPIAVHWLLTGGATSLLLGGGRALAGFCVRAPTLCAVAGPALQAWDTVEEVVLSVQLAVQTATKDPRAGETLIELQLEHMDGGVPGNTLIREVREELSQIAARHGDEAVQKLSFLSDDVVDTASRQGDGSLSALLGWEADDLVRYGPELAERAGADARALEALDRLMDLDDLASAEADKLIEIIAENSIQGSGDRFVLGVWVSHGDGYVTDARLDGGFWYETHPEVYTRLQQRYGRHEPRRIQDILWRIDVAALEVGIRQGADFDFSLARMASERYEQEATAVRLYVQGRIDDARRVLGVEANKPTPFRLREFGVLLRAGYIPSFDDATQIIRWTKP